MSRERERDAAESKTPQTPMQTMQTEARVCKRQGGSAEIANNFDAGATALRFACAAAAFRSDRERVHSHKWVSKLPCRHVALHTLPACSHRRTSGQARKQQQQHRIATSERFRGLSVSCRQHSSLDMALRLCLWFLRLRRACGFDWVFLLQIGKRTLHAMCNRARMIYDMYIQFSVQMLCEQNCVWTVAAVTARWTVVGADVVLFMQEQNKETNT